MPLVIPVFIPHQGCPHACLFCNQQAISGESKAGISAGDITAIIDEWLVRAVDGQVVQVAFYGGSFTCLPPARQRYYLQTVQPYLRAGRVDEIRLSTRPDCIDPEVLDTLQGFGVRVVELGVQSLSDRVLRQSGRGHRVEQSEEAVRLLKQAGFTVGLQLMAGLPGETTGSFFRGVRRVVELQPDFARLYPVLVVQGSGLAKLYGQKKYQPLSLARAVALSASCCDILQAAGIEVVRCGLQPSRELEDNLIAGPYHPAFGSLVRSRVWYRELRKQCSRLQKAQSLTVQVSHRQVTDVVGHKKENLKRLHQKGYRGRLTISGKRELPRGSVRYVVN